MPDTSFASVNDISCSWSDIAISFLPIGPPGPISGITSALPVGPSLQLADISAIKFGKKVDVGIQRGTSGGRVRSRTAGEASFTASATFYRNGLLQFKRMLMAVAPSRGNQLLIGLVAFDILVQHTPIGSIDIYESKIKGCRYIEDSDDNKEGTDPDKIDITFSTPEIVDLIDGFEVLLA